MTQTRRGFLKSALAFGASPVLQSSGVLSAAETLAKELAAEAEALWRADHNAILDSAFGESRLHMQMLNHFYEAGATMASLAERTQNLKARLEQLQSDGHELPELEEALEAAAKDPDKDGLDIQELEKLMDQIEGKTDEQSGLAVDAAPNDTVLPVDTASQTVKAKPQPVAM